MQIASIFNPVPLPQLTPDFSLLSMLESYCLCDFKNSFMMNIQQ